MATSVYNVNRIIHDRFCSIHLIFGRTIDLVECAVSKWKNVPRTLDFVTNLQTTHKKRQFCDHDKIKYGHDQD